jgi:NADPH:quinone reductase-like Zn-dependent oxidoreductase
VVIGLQGGRKAEVDLGRLLAARLSLMGSTLRGRDADDKAALLAAFADEVLPLFEAGRVQPVVDHVLPLPEAGRAHARMASGEVFGKLVLAVPGASGRPGHAH